MRTRLARCLHPRLRLCLRVRHAGRRQRRTCRCRVLASTLLSFDLVMSRVRFRRPCAIFQPGFRSPQHSCAVRAQTLCATVWTTKRRTSASRRCWSTSPRRRRRSRVSRLLQIGVMAIATTTVPVRNRQGRRALRLWRSRVGPPSPPCPVVVLLPSLMTPRRHPLRNATDNVDEPLKRSLTAKADVDPADARNTHRLTYSTPTKTA